MSIRLVPHGEQWRAGVRALNERMAMANKFGFFESPVPGWLPPGPGAPTHREYIVAVDDTDGHVCGGYVLRHEPALVAGAQRLVASVQGPYSEGAVDPSRARVVFDMVRDMLHRQPLLYGWGLESRPDVLRLFQTIGWRSHATPVLAWWGLPGLGGGRSEPGVVCREEPSFGAWADEVWRRCGHRYAFVVARERRLLDLLYPPASRRFRRLVVRSGDAVLGWAVVGIRTFRRHPRLRSVRLGVLWDFFAAPESAGPVIAEAHRFLRRAGAWAALASTSHPAWIAALRRQGFRVRPERRHLLVSKPLAVALTPFDERVGEVFLTFGDAESHRGWLGQAMFEE